MQVIGMESGIEKCSMLIKQSGIRKLVEGTDQPNRKCIRMLGEKKK